MAFYGIGKSGKLWNPERKSEKFKVACELHSSKEKIENRTLISHRFFPRCFKFRTKIDEKDFLREKNKSNSKMINHFEVLRNYSMTS